MPALSSCAKIGFLRRFGFISLFLLCASCNKAPAPSVITPANVFRPYRFDDQLQAAGSVNASPAPSAALRAEPIVWQNFPSESDVTWELLRGRMGFRQGDLVVKGDGSTPVIMSPK